MVSTYKEAYLVLFAVGRYASLAAPAVDTYVFVARTRRAAILPRASAAAVLARGGAGRGESDKTTPRHALRVQPARRVLPRLKRNR